ncbi:MAG: glycoside hydrolase family 2 TIM barrel-domain containing protein [bacterium]
MKTHRYIFYLLMISGISIIPVSCSQNEEEKAPVKTEIIQKEGNYTLLRNGEPYYIKGAGGQKYLSRLAEYGGNSFRLWSTNNETQESGKTISQLLNEADSLDLTVTLGLWVTHPRHNKTFYDDTVKVREQLERFRKDVIKYKDHPALLMWAVGNEVHLHTGVKKVWDAVNDIAGMIKEEDPNHVVSTITAGINPDLVEDIKTRAPEIDLIGVNAYANDLSNLPESVKEAGWEKAYFIGEYGPSGHWKVEGTPWGAKYEPTMKEKLNAYINAYNAFEEDSAHCIGSYVFKWGWKWERTYSWFNLFTREGHETASVDAMQYLWNGEWPENRSPVSGKIYIDKQSYRDKDTLVAGNSYQVAVEVENPDNDELNYDWRLYPEGRSKVRGGDPETPEAFIRDLSIEGEGKKVRIEMPHDETGYFRLYVLVSDNENNVTISNYPFFLAK